jgi:1-acyl-sn-glycerol-3-phosphate acyltransferase
MIIETSRQTKTELTQQPSLWYRLSRRFFQLSAGCLFRMKVVGEENIPAGNYIVVANHLSWIDPFLLMLVLPASPRLYFIGAQQAINRGWKDWLIRHFDVMIPFERGANWVGKGVLQQPLRVLQAGAVLGLFPEGNLGPREGEVQPLQRGIGHIVLQADSLILPIALSGVQELYLGKPITMIIGKPLHITTEGLNHREGIDLAVRQVANALRMLIPRYEEPAATVKRMRFLTNLLG